MIYLDNASTTKTSDIVNKTIACALENDYFNPSSLHTQGFDVHKKIESARKKMLSCFGLSFYDLVFTGSATEANNLALSQATRGKILVGAGEHPSVLEKAKALKAEGCDVCFLPLDNNGCVDVEEFKKQMTKDVSLVSVQLVSNETGAVNDIALLSKIAKLANPKVIFHSDMVQGFGKVACKLNSFGADLISLSAHKICGPKGIGALVFLKSIKLKPIIWGGGQENGVRSGTENVPQILAFCEAALFASENQKHFAEKASKTKSALIDLFKENNIEFIVHGNGSPFILSVSFAGVRGETLMHALEGDGILVSTGSACSSKKAGNKTLEAMGVQLDEIMGNVRVSFGFEELSNEQIEYVADCFAKRIGELKIDKGSKR